MNFDDEYHLAMVLFPMHLYTVNINQRIVGYMQLHTLVAWNSACMDIDS